MLFRIGGDDFGRLRGAGMRSSRAALPGGRDGEEEGGWRRCDAGSRKEGDGELKRATDRSMVVAEESLDPLMVMF